jgi:hypothetical protein
VHTDDTSAVQTLLEQSECLTCLTESRHAGRSMADGPTHATAQSHVWAYNRGRKTPDDKGAHR